MDLREVLTEPEHVTRWGIALVAVLLAVAAFLFDAIL